MAGGILVLSSGFVLFSTVVFLGDPEFYFFVPVSGHWGSRQDGWTGGPGRQKGGQGRQRGGGQRAYKHASHYCVHGLVAGQGMLEFKKFKGSPPPKMLRLIQNQWIWPSLTLTCLQAHVVALQELHKAMSRWICLFFNSISKFLNLSFYQNCRKIIVLRFWKGKTSNTTIATCNCNSRNLPLGPLCP